jgi:hypothetical protein
MQTACAAAALRKLRVMEVSFFAGFKLNMKSRI